MMLRIVRPVVSSSSTSTSGAGAVEHRGIAVVIAVGRGVGVLLLDAEDRGAPDRHAGGVQEVGRIEAVAHEVAERGGGLGEGETTAHVQVGARRAPRT